MKNHLIGIDIGGTKCAVCLGDNEGRILDRLEFPTDGGGPVDTLARLGSLAEELMARLGPAVTVGIACGGPLDAEKGLILSPPNLPGWDRVPIVEYIWDRLGIRAFLENDANAGALAEWRYGAGQGTRNLMFCTMGSGFGCGLILNGELYSGANGNAGELGHVRLTEDGPVGYGKAGSVEGYCGGNGISRFALEHHQKWAAQGRESTLDLATTITAFSVAEAAFSGDELALQIYREVGRKLGSTLALAIDFLNLDCIVVGSVFTRCESLIRPSMEEVLRHECLPITLKCCRIVPSGLGERIGDVAALAVANGGYERLFPI